ncbi:hypothetical protein LIER_40114 [Lithospermum erythrorhizon]|uniref:Uncharacterized protein n=1 Tax=Lithospermum erythrorhizon TaxID=34254 RepID=A0AAV3QVK0_LITER
MFRNFIQEGALLDLGYVGKEGCEEVVRHAWSKYIKGSRWFQVCEKIRDVRMGLIDWCRKNNFNSRIRIDDLQTKIKKAYDEECFNMDDILHLEKELEVAWGKKKHRHNSIIGLEDKDGVWREGTEAVEEVVLGYFGDIFSANSMCSSELAIGDMQGRVTVEMN